MPFDGLVFAILVRTHHALNDGHELVHVLCCDDDGGSPLDCYLV